MVAVFFHRPHELNIVHSSSQQQPENVITFAMGILIEIKYEKDSLHRKTDPDLSFYSLL